MAMSILVVFAIFAGIVLVAFVNGKFSKPEIMSPGEVAEMIERFVEGTGGAYDWDDFISVRIADPYLSAVQEVCSQTHAAFPPPGNRGWSDEKGIAVLRQLAADVRQYETTGVPPREPSEYLPSN